MVLPYKRFIDPLPSFFFKTRATSPFDWVTEKLLRTNLFRIICIVIDSVFKRNHIGPTLFSRNLTSTSHSPILMLITTTWVCSRTTCWNIHGNEPFVILIFLRIEPVNRTLFHVWLCDSQCEISSLFCPF